MAGSRIDGLLSGVRFGQFATVGAVGAVFDNVTLVLLRLGLGLPELLAKAVGIEVAIVVMFLVNEYWTFADEGSTGRGPFLRRLATSHGVRVGGVTVQLVVFWALTQRLDARVVVAGTDLWFLVASVVAIGVAMVANYVGEGVVTWRVGE